MLHKYLYRRTWRECYLGTSWYVGYVIYTSDINGDCLRYWTNVGKIMGKCLWIFKIWIDIAYHIYNPIFGGSRKQCFASNVGSRASFIHDTSVWNRCMD